MKNTDDIKKIEFQKYVSDKLEKTISDIRKRMLKDNLRYGYTYEYINTDGDNNYIINESRFSDVEFSPFYILAHLISKNISIDSNDYDFQSDLRFRMISKDEITKYIDSNNERLMKAKEKYEHEEYKMYLELRKKYEKNTEKKA